MHRASLFGSQDQELDRMVATMCRPDGAPQMSCLATALDGSRFLAQTIRFNRLRGTLMEAAGMDDPAVILILTPIGDSVAGREAALRAFSSFTPMEGAIAMALVNGQSISDIARERRISIPTIRWHIRNMIEKTGENGVRGLTRILTLLLPY
jgi:DNA-binding NarL/FixJ family response regulator